VQIAVGLFRKVVIADSLAKYVDPIYNNPEYYNSTTLIIATVFYAFQIYFDFAGYSDIAIGIAKTLGFKFNRNFNLPYFSKSMTEFWRRWHISLSSWLKDYLYISLGGNRRGIKIQYRNLLITMLLGGLWHGSSWNFVIWGAIHGLILSIEKFIFQINLFPFMKMKIFHLLGGIITFILVCFAWIFFRAQTLESALLVINGILDFNFGKPFIRNINVIASIVFGLSIGVLFDLFLFVRQITLQDYGKRFSSMGLSLFLAFCILSICLFYSSSNNFIYFQF